MKEITIKGEGINQMQLQRSIYTQLNKELSEIDASEITVNVAIGSMLMDLYEFEACTRSDEEVEELENDSNKLYQIGLLEGIIVKVDPMMRWDDTRVISEGLIATIDTDPSMIM